MKKLVNDFKRFYHLNLGKHKHLRVKYHLNKKWYGNDYGGFYVNPDIINANSVIYSFGIGQDISFDKSIITNHNAEVHAFDPTPKSIEWIKKQDLPKKFHFYEIGIGAKTEKVNFFLPRNPDFVSGSILDSMSSVDQNQKTEVQLMCLKDIMTKLGHDKIDLLKMDIEGAEYSVIEDILSSEVEIPQICMEFHDRMIPHEFAPSHTAILKLEKKGYRIFGVSETFEEVSLVLIKAN